MAYDYAVDRLIRVLDGDTVDIRLFQERDVGFGFSTRWMGVLRIRLILVDTPEKHDPLYAAGTEFTAAWLAEHLGVVRVRTYKPRNVTADGGFGRWLGDFYLPDGTTLSGELLRCGFMAYSPRMAPSGRR